MGDAAQVMVDRADPACPILWLSGELDITCAEAVARVVEQTAAGRPERMIFDLGELSFMDSSGLAVLLKARLMAPVELRASPPSIRRVIEASGLGGVFELQPAGARSAQRFAAVPGSVAAARHFAVHGLAGMSTEMVEAVAVMVSELATNALQHSGTDFDLSLEFDGGRLRVEVADSGGGQPALRQPTPEELRGRGLQIVRRLSDDWGVARRPDAGAGKVVWFELSIPSA